MTSPFLLSRRDFLAALATSALAAETAGEAKRRKERLARRRAGVDVLCHRGASEFAHENTLEAYRAALELGADGNEIDIRATRDGVLVCFHDDMLDRLLEAHGDAGDYPWAELRRFRFRDPGPFGEHCRIPTLEEVLALHREHAGLLHLDVKRPGLEKPIIDLIERMDLWDHIAYCNDANAPAIVKHKSYRPRRYKAGLYLDRSEVDPQAIAAALKKPGDGLIVDDPRGALVALGRKLGKPSATPVAPLSERPAPPVVPPQTEEQLIRTLLDADDWNKPAESAEDRRHSGERIRARARAAEQVLARGMASKKALAALEERVRRRSLHKEWMYHGLDGAMALRTLILLRAPSAVELARFVLWRDDPDLEPVVNPMYKNPRSWTDFRVKMVVLPALAKHPGTATEKLCRDYLALSDDDARKLGPPIFEEAGRTLLAVSPRTDTALELMKHRLPVVRGRAVLDCLRRHAEPWARTALEKGAPHARAYVV